MSGLGVLGAIFAGVQAGLRDKTPREWEYEYLEDTPVLHSSDYLMQLYVKAEHDWEKDLVVNHLFRHDVVGKGCEGYDKIYGMDKERER